MSPEQVREAYAERLTRNTGIRILEADRIIMDLFGRTPQALCEQSYGAFLTFYRETGSVRAGLELAELWYLARRDNLLQ